MESWIAYETVPDMCLLQLNHYLAFPINENVDM